MTLTTGDLLADLHAKQDAQPKPKDPKCARCGYGVALRISRDAKGREIKTCVMCGTVQL